MSFFFCLKLSLFLIAQEIRWQKQKENEFYTTTFKEKAMKIRRKIKNLVLKDPPMTVVHNRNADLFK